MEPEHPDFATNQINSPMINNSTSKSRYTFNKEQRFVPVKTSGPGVQYDS